MVDQYHTFRVKMDTGGMPALMMRGKIANWLLENARGQAHVGNGFGASKHHPQDFPFENPLGRDLFVLLDNLVDMARFEEEFEVEPPPNTWSRAVVSSKTPRKVKDVE